MIGYPTRLSMKNLASSNVSSIRMNHLPSYEAAIKMLMTNEQDFNLPNIVSESQDSDSSYERNERIIA